MVFILFFLFNYEFKIAVTELKIEGFVDLRIRINKLN